MQQFSNKFVALAVALLLRLASIAEAHGHDENMSMDMGEPAMSRPTVAQASGSSDPQTYYQYGEHPGLIMAHILLMTIAWVFILPIGVLLSISRSRYKLPVQLTFLAINGIGVFLATIYNTSTPDLYPNNAHHKLGWVLTWTVCAQAIMGIISAYGNRRGGKSEERKAFIPISAEVMAEHQRLHGHSPSDIYRFSNDSGQGTEPNTESLRSQSISSASSDQQPLPELRHDEEDEQFEKVEFANGSRLDRYLSKKIPGLLSSRALQSLHFFHNAIDRIILIFGFVALTTGIITYGGFFMGAGVFSGLAHFIKGGVFFWYGILTLGRWAGCFQEIGWAWNINPSKIGKRSFTAEFVESFLIFFYGSTNIFLEHLARWGKEWSAQDLEHISITVMFIGGGLCGMFIESKGIRDLLSVTQESAQIHSRKHSDEELQEPKSYRFSMNPLPALVVLLLGLMMSSHHQSSMISAMIHKQWGTLLVGAAFARAATYVIFYLSPPTSILPGRPPTEIITAFCLMAGGTVFMSSARDTVSAMESNNLDAMFVFTVTMGLITFLMAWIILVIAIKGWAVRKENKPNNFAYRSVAVV